MGPRVTKFRKIPRDQLTPEQRREYSAAIVAKIQSLQRAAVMRDLPSFRPSCASGTWHNNGDGAVGAAVRDQQARALLACPDQIRAARSVVDLELQYKAAMAAKRKALAAAYQAHPEHFARAS
jgi:hypothetical protein